MTTKEKDKELIIYIENGEKNIEPIEKYQGSIIQNLAMNEVATLNIFTFQNKKEKVLVTLFVWITTLSHFGAYNVNLILTTPNNSKIYA